jgi:hypothetical protein
MHRFSTHLSARARRGLRLVVMLGALAGSLLAPAQAAAITQVYPEPGQHLEWLSVRPIVAFDVAQGEKPKWVLLSSDHEMKTTVRYCRQFVSVVWQQKYHWGCNAWAVGVDWLGQDVIRPLTWNRTYYWQVVYTDAAGHEQKGRVREFTIDNQPATQSPGAISQQIYDSVYGDGTNLNLGAAAFTNSGVRTPTMKARRHSKYRFMIDVSYTGEVDLLRSYIRIQSSAGTRYIPLRANGTGKALGSWLQAAAERRLKTKKFTYQVFLKAKKNGAMVRSAPRILLIKPRKAPPAWTPTR